MTDNYKDDVLKYITGNLQQQVGVNEPTFEDVETTTNNLYTQIKSYFSSRVAYVDFIPSKNNKNQSLEYSVLACRGTLNGETEETGAFVILDREYNLVDIITHYSDGSLIGILYCLNVDDSGNYFAVDTYDEVNYRIVALNNLVLKPAGSNTYQAIKVDTHAIPNAYSWEAMLKVFRNSSASKYFVVGERSDINAIVGCELEIESTDTWHYYTTTYWRQNAFAMFDNGYNVYWDSSGELHFQIGVSSDGLIVLTKGSGSTMVGTRYTYNEGVGSSRCTLIFASNKIGYYGEVYSDSDTNTTLYNIYKVNLETKAHSLIFSKSGDYTLYDWLFFFKNNNGIYFYYNFRTQNDAHEFDLTFGFINDTTIYEQPLGTFTASSFLYAFCYPNAITDFNNNYIYIQNQETLFSLHFKWNINNYNGIPYTSYNSLIPNIITIEDENEVELFDRNIYNLSSYSNWYTASVQIPNYFLNNVNLNSALLYSKGNNLMASAYINANKNIYEELLINFTNKFRIIDRTTNTENIIGANQLVSSMLSKNPNVYISKFKINYDDDTSEIKNLTYNNLVYTDLKTTLKLAIYTNKKINSIELLSQDETISYNTINCSNLELNKYYLISLDLKIE